MRQSQMFPAPSISDLPTHRLPTLQRTSPPNQASSPFSGWMLFPQRLFLALTFIYAGIQKYTDPQFFHKATPGYIGNQIIGFAHNSPLQNLLLKLVLPHAMLFGQAIALGELAIGLGILVGLLFRPAAFFGLVLSTTFFLTASWNAYPYFYGADIVFMFCWFTLLLAGPLPTGMPTLDAWLLRRFFRQVSALQQNLLFRLLCLLLLGANTLRLAELVAFARPRPNRAQAPAENRRAFLRVALLGGTTVAGVAALSLVLRVFTRPGVPGKVASASKATPTAVTGVSTATPATGTAVPETGKMLAKASALPVNSAMTFTIPSSGDPGVLIHLANKQFVAYDATCTHNGCQVAYDPDSQHLVCPCHGATFDPAQQAAVLQGPADTPLTSVPLHVYDSGDITLAS